MFDTVYNYTRVASIHEFTSPTYTHVQLTALYAGYIHAARPGNERRRQTSRGGMPQQPRRCNIWFVTMLLRGPMFTLFFVLLLLLLLFWWPCWMPVSRCPREVQTDA